MIIQTTVNSFLKAIFLTCFVIGTLYAEDFTTLDGDHYSAAAIKRVEPDGLVIAYSDGVKKLKFKNLPTQIGKQYGYNPVVESQYLAQQQASAAASYQPAIQPPQSANISQNIAASIPSSLTQGSPISPVVPSISDSIKTLFSNVYISIKESVKSFLLKWLHILFPWAFSTPTVNSPTTTNAPPPTPQQIINGVLTKKPIEATELASVLEQYPQQTVEALNTSPSKLITINGNVELFSISGSDQERAEIKLLTDQKTKIYIYYDLKRDNPDTTEEWKINDQRLFLVSKGNPNNTTSLICIEGGSLEHVPGKICNGLDVRLKSFSPNPLRFTPYTLIFKLQR